MSSYLPALHTMFAFGDLYAHTGRIDAAKEMYYRALAGYASVQGPASKWCRELENRLQALKVASAEPNNDQIEPKEMEASKPSSSLKRIFRKLRIRSGAG
ncbi:hypothetical protein EJ04DRAFT_91221 [Polyplosphaeria fusca]|uniref:Uncharacterized protein n=1 Tax=Polyplosphaeria fusca TaxID=682080 RepID=A0A9P4QPF7_9PLEO|nr:hypothetical protein EJ04DRAFT_91221 [Polyplosphaeria fusca]